MNKFLLVLGWSVAFAMILAACGSADTSTTDSVTVLEDYYAALTAGDLEKAMSFVVDDAIFIDPMSKHVGIAEIRAGYAAQMNIGGKWEATNIKDTNGKGRLVYDCKAFINDVPVYTGTGLTVVQNGKITFDGTEFYWKGECEREPSQSFCAD
ncbi:MAG TPA: nuclear transport factor 2 family protein [Anaerolineales bacterium]